MRAVWSFWSEPHRGSRCHAWQSELHHLLAWSLSVQEAAKHYSNTWLYTDDDGARLLADRLRLPFANIRTDLNELRGYDPGWWALGKLHTYRLQTEPFVHIDCDVFLWLPLPERLIRADVFAQNPEPFLLGASSYKPERLEQALERVSGWLPEEWRWFRTSAGALRGECCGLLGGNRLDFIRYVADLAFRIINHEVNRTTLAHLGDKLSTMVVLEQFLLAACVEYHRIGHRESPFHGIEMAYLFDSGADVFNAELAASAGYTHLLAGTKRNPAVIQLLEERVLQDDPQQYERCARLSYIR